MKYKGIQFRKNRNLTTRRRQEPQYQGGSYIEFGRVKSNGEVEWIPGSNGMTNMMYGEDGRTYTMLDGQCYQSAVNPEFASGPAQVRAIREIADACIEDGNDWRTEKMPHGHVRVFQMEDDGEVVRTWTAFRHGGLTWET